MILLEFWTFLVCFSFVSAEGDQLKPGLIQEFSNVFHNLSNLALMPNLMETPECRRDCEIYYRAFLQNQFWAAEMFDANGRQSLGIINGNLHQLGNINQCMSVEMSQVESKFCFIKIYLKPSENNALMKKIWKKAFYGMIATSKPYEKNVMPSPDTILSALCVPSSCTSFDVVMASRKVLSVFNETAFGLEVHVDDLTERNCVVQREYHSDKISLASYAKIFIITMMILVSCATVIDVFFLQDGQSTSNSVLILSKSFSLQQNLRTVLSIENDRDKLGCLNGLRCITYFIIYILHYSLKFAVFAVDRPNFTQILRYPLIKALIIHIPFVLDMLIFLSGISHSYKLTLMVMRNDGKSILKSILYKYLRLLLFFLTFFIIQSTSVNKNELHLLYLPATTKPDFWSVIFCFENFYGTENMFFVPLYSFYTDLQLYLVACAVLLLTKRFNHNVKLYFFLAFSSLFFRSLFFYFYAKVQTFITFGMSLKQAWAMMTYLYMTPFSRLPFYMSGVALGYYMRNKSDHDLNICMSSFYRKIGKVLPLLSIFIAMYCYYPTNNHYEYNNFDGAVLTFINSFSTMVFLTWTVWYCETFKKLSITYRFLTADQFVILNRLTPFFSALHMYVLSRVFIGSRFIFEFKLSEVLGLDYLLLCILVCLGVMLFIYLPLRNTWVYLTTKKDTTQARNKNE